MSRVVLAKVVKPLQPVLPRVEEREFRMAMTLGAGGLDLSGYAILFNHPYQAAGWQEVFKPSSCRKSLMEQSSAVLDLRVLETDPLADLGDGSFSISQDSRGLLVEASFEVTDTEPAVSQDSAVVMALSYRVIVAKWSPDFTSRTITELSFKVE